MLGEEHRIWQSGTIASKRSWIEDATIEALGQAAKVSVDKIAQLSKVRNPEAIAQPCWLSSNLKLETTTSEFDRQNSRTLG